MIKKLKMINFQIYYLAEWRENAIGFRGYIDANIARYFPVMELKNEKDYYIEKEYTVPYFEINELSDKQ